MSLIVDFNVFAYSKSTSDTLLMPLVERNFSTLIVYFLVVCVSLRLIEWLSLRLQSGAVREKILVSQQESAKARMRAPEQGQILELHPLAQGYYVREYCTIIDVYVTLGINLTNFIGALLWKTKAADKQIFEYINIHSLGFKSMDKD